MNYTAARPTKLKGFTLIEIVIGIVVLAIALTLLSTLILPQARLSVSPVYQVRAAELGQSVLQDAIARSFDINSDRSGGRVRCGDGGDAPECAAIPMPDSGHCMSMVREEYRSVADFNCMSTIQRDQYLTQRYPGYELMVEVTEGYANPGVMQPEAFRTITVTVTTPEPERQQLVFSALKGNF